MHSGMGRLMRLIIGFICLRITEQNAHIIAAAIQNTVNIDIFSISPIKYKVISAYEKTVVAFCVRNRRKRGSYISLIFQDTDFLCDSAYGCQSCVRVFKFLRDIGFDRGQVILCLFR